MDMWRCIRGKTVAGCLPVILGNGVKLFPSEGMMWKLYLSYVSHESVIAELVYERKKNP